MKKEKIEPEYTTDEAGDLEPDFENCIYVQISKDEYEKYEKGEISFPQTNGKTILPYYELTFINQRIKELRLEHKLTQNDLAEVLGISQREYWRYEQEGYGVSILKLAYIAIFYNVSIDWFTGLYPEKKPFFPDKRLINIRGYILEEMKEAKAKGEKYTPH